jgi:endonuclease/exonuclease/phosphatase family metal-dependent hydrolase
MAELVDNRCRCKPLQTPEGGQLSLEVILCRKIWCRGDCVCPSAHKRFPRHLAHPAARGSRSFPCTDKEQPKVPRGGMKRAQETAFDRVRASPVGGHSGVVPVDSGSRLRFRWRPSWLAVGAVLAVAGFFATAIRLPSASHGSSSAMPSVSVMTARMSPAATPSVPSVAPLLVPGLGASVVATLCQERRSPVLRVLQFNIHAAISGAGGVQVSQIAAEIEAVQPDLVSLNEVDSHTLRTRVDEPAYLAKATGLHVVYGPNLIYDGGPFGNAILTRYPVVESHNLRLPGTFGLEPRGLLTAVVIVDGRRVAFSSTHLTEGSGGRQSRLLQALAVARALHSMAAPTILAGDLNSDSTDVPRRILRGHLLDAQEEGGTGLGDTFPEANPSSRFDYIFYDDHFAVVPGSTRVQTSNSSDHRSVFTKLTLLPKHRC